MPQFIKTIKAKVINASNDVKTIEVELETTAGFFSASAPSGVSTGANEAKAIEPQKAKEKIENIISPNLKGFALNQQQKLDEFLIELDGTENKSFLGANSILSVSIAYIRASAKEQGAALWQKISQLASQKSCLPKPLLLLGEGGKHAPLEARLLTGHSKSGLSIQEFLIISRELSFKDNFKQVCDVYNSLKAILKKRFGKEGISQGYEGGFAPKVKSSLEMLDLIVEAIDKAGLKDNVKIALDCAASEFFKDGYYLFEGKRLTAPELADTYFDFLIKYPIVSLEDPFSEDDVTSWGLLTSNCQLQTTNHQLFVVGDDLTTTNVKRMQMAKEKQACNAVILKPNQIGTIWETIQAGILARNFGWKIIVSHRAGETKDDFIADLAVGLGADYIKTGGPYQAERKAKYKRLLEIERELYK